MKIQIIFDKDTEANSYSCGWGVSYLLDDRVLFDTGENSQYLLNNLKEMGISPERLEKVVISHKHLAHRGGLPGLLTANRNLKIFACLDFLEEFKDEISDSNCNLVEKTQEIAENIYTSGCFKVPYHGKELSEQALIVKTAKGVSLVCGCSHPGILQFLVKIKDLFPQQRIYSIIGGFHFIDKDKRYIEYTAKELKNKRVENVGPSHCTGFSAKKILKKHYPDHFFDIKVGKQFEI